MPKIPTATSRARCWTAWRPASSAMIFLTYLIIRRSVAVPTPNPAVSSASFSPMYASTSGSAASGPCVRRRDLPAVTRDGLSGTCERFRPDNSSAAVTKHRSPRQRVRILIDRFIKQRRRAARRTVLAVRPIGRATARSRSEMQDRRTIESAREPPADETIRQERFWYHRSRDVSGKSPACSGLSYEYAKAVGVPPFQW
jgi:hypothetical protein